MIFAIEEHALSYLRSSRGGTIVLLMVALNPSVLKPKGIDVVSVLLSSLMPVGVVVSLKAFGNNDFPVFLHM